MDQLPLDSIACLKTMEIAGNRYAKERFQQLGVPKVSGLYEYENQAVQKYKTELANKVN